MNQNQHKRSAFSGKIGFVLSAAGASVGLGNIWRFPYLAAKYGGGIFLLIYIILAFTFGYTMIVAETALGRMTRKSPVGAFAAVRKGRRSFGGWINAIIPILIVPYYSVIGGWVIRYLADYISGHGSELATDGYFSAFISSGASAEICFVIFTIFTLAIIFAGVRNGVERVSKVMMPIPRGAVRHHRGLLRHPPGCAGGVKYFLVPNLSHFSWMTVVTAMGQMFYSLSIAMGILVTFGSYMKKDVSIEESTENVEIFDTAIAIMAGLMIIPAVFSFSGGDPDTLQAGPALMFITIPKVFESMGLGTVVGILFFTLVLFAAVTSSIALTESAVSTFEDELGWNRKQATVLIGIIMLVLGSLSALGYGPLARFTVFGMQFLDFFDFLTNSVMMPIAAITTCLLVSRVIGVEKIEEEVTLEGKPFRRKRIFNFMIKYLCPIFAAVIPHQLGGKRAGRHLHVKQTTKALEAFTPPPALFLCPFQDALYLVQILYKINAALPLGAGQPHLDHVGQQSFQPGVVAVEVIEDAGRVQMTQRDLGHHLGDLFQRAGAAGERDKGVAQLYHPDLALGHVLRDDKPGQAVILHLGVDEELGLDAGHFTARRQNAVGQTPYRAAAGAAVDQRVPALADPAAQFLHRLLRGRVAALIGPPR